MPAPFLTVFLSFPSLHLLVFMHCRQSEDRTDLDSSTVPTVSYCIRQPAWILKSQSYNYLYGPDNVSLGVRRELDMAPCPYTMLMPAMIISKRLKTSVFSWNDESPTTRTKCAVHSQARRGSRLSILSRGHVQEADTPSHKAIACNQGIVPSFDRSV